MVKYQWHIYKFYCENEMYIFLFLTEPDVYMINHEREISEGDLDIVVFHDRFVESLVESNDVIGEGDDDDDK